MWSLKVNINFIYPCAMTQVCGICWNRVLPKRFKGKKKGVFSIAYNLWASLRPTGQQLKKKKINPFTEFGFSFTGIWCPMGIYVQRIKF